MKITRAAPEMETELKALWKECFGDSDAYIDMFFRERFEPRRTVAALEGGALLGAAHILPAVIDSRPLLYGYAVATFPKYRGRGVCRKMHEEIFRWTKLHKAVYAVHPQDGALADMYRAFGMKDSFYYKEAELRPMENTGEKAVMSPLPPEEFSKMWREELDKRPFCVRWDGEHAGYAARENLFCGGFCIKISYENRDYAACGEVRDESVYIRETTMDYAAAAGAAGAIAKALCRDKVICRLPCAAPESGEVAAGLSYGLDGGRWYLGLMLD